MVSNRYRGQQTITTKLNNLDTKVGRNEKKRTKVVEIPRETVTEDQLPGGTVGTPQMGVVNEIVTDSNVNIVTPPGGGLTINGVPLAAAATPSGVLNMWAGPVSTPPVGWLICNGAAVSRTTYANLFAAVGTEFGAGDGSTTFNLPNFKGKVPVGYDAAQAEFDDLGSSGGAKTHTLTTAEIPSHQHQETANSGAIANGGGSALAGLTFAGGDITPTVQSTVATGGGGAHNNLQPYLVVSYIIST